ncbi:hypothetical protein CHUAL_005732 [Chamberlinius hualienensis]
MAGVEYDLDTSGGLMPQIQALLAPPSSEENKKLRKGEKDRNCIKNRRPGRSVNHDCCDSCNEGGDLICCDNCPAAFHLQCHDPPLDEDDLPTGEWLCHCCRMQAKEKAKAENDVASMRNSLPTDENATEILGVDDDSADERGNGGSNDEDEEEESPLEKLIRAASLMNPKQFQLPNELQCTTVLPGNYSSRSQGCNKRLQRREGNRNGAKKVAHELDNGLVPLPAKVCFECRKSCLRAPLIQCDFCPLLFHQDCLDPPLTTLPTGRWMCPNHPENILDQKLLTSVSLSERVKLWNHFNGRISQDTVKLEFLKKVHRQHPPFRYKIKLPPRNRVQVPNAVKEQYKNPPKLLPRRNEPMEDYFSTKSDTNCDNNVDNLNVLTEEQELWLTNVVSLQTSIAKCLMQKKLVKKSKNINGDSDVSDGASRQLCEDNSVLSSVAKESSQSQQSPNHVTQRFVNGEVYSLNNSKVSTDTISRTKINNVSESTSSGVNIECKTLKFGNATVKTPISNFNLIQRTGRCGRASDANSTNGRTSSSFSHEAVSFPKYTVASTSQGPIATNSTYVLQMKSPNKHQQTTASNNCSDYLSYSKLSTPYSVPANRGEAAFEDYILSDSTKFNHLNNVLQSSMKDMDMQLNQLDEKLVHVLAYQRLQQLISRKKDDESKNVPDIQLPKIMPVVRSRAVLAPVGEVGRPGLMTYRVFTIGTGDDVNLSLFDYGHCNYVSARHACIFYDEGTKQYELLNYSEHGTLVDNVVYSCDFSDKYSAVSTPTSVVAAIRTIIDKYRGKSGCHLTEKLTMTSQAVQTNKACKCSCASVNSTAVIGWEGTAALHHGSLLRFGCLSFVFSITENATREALTTTKKSEIVKPIKSDGPPMLAVSNATPKQPGSRES